MGASLGLSVPVAVAVTVWVTVLVTVPPGALGTERHVTVNCWDSPLSITVGLDVQVARVDPPLVAACATATVPPQTRAIAARGIRTRFDMYFSPGRVVPRVSGRGTDPVTRRRWRRPVRASGGGFAAIQAHRPWAPTIELVGTGHGLTTCDMTMPSWPGKASTP